MRITLAPKTVHDRRRGMAKRTIISNPGRTVVLAQTGVTGVQIDNLSLDIVKGPVSGNTFAHEHLHCL